MSETGQEQVQQSANSSPENQGEPLIAPNPAGSSTKKADHKVENGWIQSLQSLVITVIIAVFVITFIVQAFQIPSESMENTLLIGDYLLVDKSHYGPAGVWGWLLPYQNVRRGDIIVFRYPVNPTQHFVKRVIGVPGDRIRLVQKRLYVNGKLQYEPYTIHRRSDFDSFRDDFPRGDFGFAHLDSRWYDQIRTLTEDGQLIVPAGYYFAMGDNRDESLDSRYWGFVPRANIVGRPLIIYWSLKASEPDDPTDVTQPPNGKLARFIYSVKQGWRDLRWRRMLTLVR